MRVAMVISTVGFHWEEVYDAYKEFKEADWGIDFFTVAAQPAVADPKSLEVRPILSAIGLGLRNSYSPDTELGKEISYMARYETQAISKMEINKFDALYIPGGHGCLFDVNTHSTLHNKILEAYKQEKILAAVCHGTSTFAFVKENGVSIISGKRMIGFPDFMDNILLRFGLVHENYTPLPFSNEQKMREAGAIITVWDLIFSAINPLYNITDEPFITGVGPKAACGVARKVIKLASREEEQKVFSPEPTFA
jgi:putative intracellular protease/amidase